MQEVIEMYEEALEEAFSRELGIPDYLDDITWAVIWLIGCRDMISLPWSRWWKISIWRIIFS